MRARNVFTDGEVSTSIGRLLTHSFQPGKGRKPRSPAESSQTPRDERLGKLSGLLIAASGPAKDEGGEELEEGGFRKRQGRGSAGKRREGLRGLPFLPIDCLLFPIAFTDQTVSLSGKVSSDTPERGDYQRAGVVRLSGTPT